MDSNIALSFQRPRFDPDEGRRNALAMRQAQMQEATQMMQLQQAQKAAQQSTARRNALSAVDWSSPDSLGQARSTLGKQGDFDAVMSIDNHMRSLKKDEREAAAAELGIVKDAAGLMATPETYGQGVELIRRYAPGFGAQIPDQYSPEIADGFGRLGLGIKGWEEKQRADRSFGETVRHNKAVENKPAAGDNVLVEIYDPDSPTGTRMVPRAQAAGKPGKPSSSMEITTPDGTVIRQGRGGAGGLERSTKGATEKETIELSSRLDRVSEIERSFKPEYQELSTRWSNLASGMKEKMGISLDDSTKKQLQDYSRYRRQSFDELNQTVRAMSGATVPVQEMPRLMRSMPNPGTGLFDGDSPTEFLTKLKDTKREIYRSIIRRNIALGKGLDPLKSGIDLSDVDGLIDKRGAEIEAKLMQENPQADPQAIKATVQDLLSRELGIQ